MHTALDAAPDSLDEAARTFVANVRKRGWMTTSVTRHDDHPNYCFTTGLWVNIGWPEFVIFSMNREDAHAVFGDLHRDAAAGRPVPEKAAAGEIFDNFPARCFPVANGHYRDLLGWSRWFYGGDAFPCLHIVWPDASGLFPWEAGFDPRLAASQPDLTEEGWAAAVRR